MNKKDKYVPSLRSTAVASAIEYNRKMWTAGILADLPAYLHWEIGREEEFVDDVAFVQTTNSLGVDGKLGPETLRVVSDHANSPKFWLTNNNITVFDTPSARLEIVRTNGLASIKAFGIHTTGDNTPAVVHKLKDRHKVSYNEAELRFIKNLMSDPKGYFSHAAILSNGAVCVCTPAREVALHGGVPVEDQMVYAAGYDQWINRIKNPDKYKELMGKLGLSGPSDFPSPNKELYAVDLLPVVNSNGKIDFTAPQYETLAHLILWASLQFGVSITPTTVLHHSWWSPLKRWDWCPGPAFSRTELQKRLSAHSEQITVVF